MALLSVQKMTKHFGGLTAVSDLSFEVRPGEILGLIGPNGAGKTTVFNCLTGFQTPETGEILFEGRSVLGLRPHLLCRLGITRTFQIVKPFLNIPVLDNVMVGSLLRASSIESARDQALEILRLVGLERMVHAEAHALPLPMRKRLELAKTLATKPKLLLLDEVMAGLNPSEVDEIIALVKAINGRGISVLLIEHVMRGVMALSHRVLVINYGRRIAEGPPEVVVKAPEVIEAYLGREFLGTRGNVPRGEEGKGGPAC